MDTAEPPQPSPTAVSAAAAAESTPEIPESVTAELEKLEQDGAMEPLEGMGNDFNIADPELDRAPGGGKTNILDFDLSEEHSEEKKEQAARPQHAGKPIERHPELPATQKPAQTQPADPLVPPPPAGPAVQIQQMQGKPQLAAQGIRPTLPLQQQQHQAQLQAAGFLPQQQQMLRAMSPAQLQAVAAQQQQIRLTQQQQMAGKPQQLQRVLPPMGSAAHMLQHAGRLQAAAAAPPPPPYPGPPPPYPSAQPQQGQQQQGPLLQEQPLLLEELLEQEKREKERQQAAQAMQQTPHEQHAGPGAAAPETSGQLLSNVEFERVRAEVLSTPTSGGSPSGLSPPAIPEVDPNPKPMVAGEEEKENVLDSPVFKSTLETITEAKEEEEEKEGEKGQEDCNAVSIASPLPKEFCPAHHSSPILISHDNNQNVRKSEVGHLCNAHNYWYEQFLATTSGSGTSSTLEQFCVVCAYVAGTSLELKEDWFQMSGGAQPKYPNPPFPSAQPAISIDYITYSKLSSEKQTLSPAIDRQKLENYLTEHEFYMIFKMDRNAWQAIPKWRKDILKKNVNLF